MNITLLMNRYFYNVYQERIQYALMTLTFFFSFYISPFRTYKYFYALTKANQYLTLTVRNVGYLIDFLFVTDPLLGSLFFLDNTSIDMDKSITPSLPSIHIRLVILPEILKSAIDSLEALFTSL